MNVVTGPEEVGEAVLIRALEPTEGIDLMGERRNLDPTTKLGLRGLTSGPGKLVIAMGIERYHNFLSLTEPGSDFSVFIRPRVLNDFEMVTTTRIGITRGADLPYRFYVKGNRFVSKL